MSFHGKVFIVTGASSGIGASLTIEALKQGAKVTAVGRNQVKLNKLLQECDKQASARPLVVIADISKEDLATDVINKTIKEYGKIDVLVNNAGFARAVNIADPTALEAYDSIMATNMRAVIKLTQLAIPYLEVTKGNIINISSAVSERVIKDLWAYATSKAALDHFTRCMAVDLAAKGIRVNSVNPGPVATDFALNMGMTQEQIEKQFEKVEEVTLLRRTSTAEEIAHLILFVASSRAVGITGSRYLADNGYSLIR